jgi:hypothetical protein
MITVSVLIQDEESPEEVFSEQVQIPSDLLILPFPDGHQVLAETKVKEAFVQAYRDWARMTGHVR